MHSLVFIIFPLQCLWRRGKLHVFFVLLYFPPPYRVIGVIAMKPSWRLRELTRPTPVTTTSMSRTAKVLTSIPSFSKSEVSLTILRQRTTNFQLLLGWTATLQKLFAGFDFVFADPVSMATVIGVIIGCLILLVIVVLIILYSFKAEKWCFSRKFLSLSTNRTLQTYQLKTVTNKY